MKSRIETLIEYIMKDHPDLPEATAENLVCNYLQDEKRISDLRAFVDAAILLDELLLKKQK